MPADVDATVGRGRAGPHDLSAVPRGNVVGQGDERLSSRIVERQFAHHGHRRELGRQEHAKLLQYLRDKHKEIEPMGCRGCGGRRGRMRQPTQILGSERSQMITHEPRRMQSPDINIAGTMNSQL